MKKITVALLLALLLCSCGQKQEETTPSFTSPAETAPTETVTETEVPPEVNFSFSDLTYQEFHFNSGAGAWGTILIIRSDGSFWGTYQDTNMGELEDAYPNGSIYRSDFSGQFSQPQWQDACTGVLKIVELNYEATPGTVEIREGTRFNYSTAHGLLETDEMVLYLPGKSLAQLPEQYIPWAGLYGYEGTELPHYGLYNPGQETGFYGINTLDTIRSSIKTAADADAEINLWLETHYTQAEMNDGAQQKYQVWDSALNQLWADLKGLLSEEEMRKLTIEELAWIREKEAAALEASAEYEGGSIYPSIYYGTLADLTKQRVYELLEYLPCSQ